MRILFLITILVFSNSSTGSGTVQGAGEVAKAVETAANANIVLGTSVASTACSNPAGAALCTTALALIKEALFKQKKSAKDIEDKCRRRGGRENNFCSRLNPSIPNSPPSINEEEEEELETTLLCMQNAQHPDCPRNPNPSPPQNGPDDLSLKPLSPPNTRILSADALELAGNRCEKNPSACAKKAVEALKNSGLRIDPKGAVIFPDGKKVSPPFGPEEFKQAGFDPQMIENSFKSLNKFKNKMEKKFKNRLKNLNTPAIPIPEETAGEAAEEPTLTSGSAGRRGRSSSNRAGGGQIDYFKHLQAGIKGQNGRSLQNFKPKQLGSSKVGTSYDDIFQMVSKSYRKRQEP